MYDLGLTPKAFWEMTPAQIFTLMKRRELEQVRSDFQAGIIASTIANVHRPKNKKPFKPQDFMPLSKKELEQKRSPDQLLQAFRMIADVHNARVAERGDGN